MQATDLVKPVTAEEILAEFEVTLPPAKAETLTCGVCGGSGTVPVSSDRRDGETTCPGCGGTGEA